MKMNRKLRHNLVEKLWNYKRDSIQIKISTSVCWDSWQNRRPKMRRISRHDKESWWAYRLVTKRKSVNWIVKMQHWRNPWKYRFKGWLRPTPNTKKHSFKNMKRIYWPWIEWTTSWWQTIRILCCCNNRTIAWQDTSDSCRRRSRTRVRLSTTYGRLRKSSTTTLWSKYTDSKSLICDFIVFFSIMQYIDSGILSQDARQTTPSRSIRSWSDLVFVLYPSELSYGPGAAPLE